MAIVDVNWNPSQKELKAFSLLLILFFLIVAGFTYSRGTSPDAALILAGGGTATGIAGILCPSFIRIIYIIWMTAAFPIGIVVSNVIVALAFYIVVCPIGILSKLTGRNALQLGFDRDAKTYWNTRQPVKNPRRYFRQY